MLLGLGCVNKKREKLFLPKVGHPLRRFWPRRLLRWNVLQSCCFVVFGVAADIYDNYLVMEMNVSLATGASQ